MPSLTVVMTREETPNLKVWNDAMKEAGFDVKLDPYPRYDDPRLVPVHVLDREVPIAFDLVPASTRADWFPIGMLQVRQATWVARFDWVSDEPYEHLAALAAASTLARLAMGVVFLEDRLHARFPKAIDPEVHALQARLAAGLAPEE